MTGGHREVPLYDQFGDRYDLMVDWAGRIARESPFFEAVFTRMGARRVLDVGCATGHHAAHFARLGLEVVGADPSAELLRIARERFDSVLGLSFIAAGLGELGESVVGQFDVVICLGNTLPHVPDEAALRSALVDVAAVLRPGGRLVIQQLNYDRILATRQRYLGVGSRDDASRELVFFRFYDFPASGGEDTLVFNVATFERPSRGEWRYRVDATTLLPITVGQVTSALSAAGLESEDLLGGFDGQPFEPAASNDLVVVARRR